MSDLAVKMQKNYEAFHLMTLSTTFLNSAAFGDFQSDAERIINFIGEAYKLDHETVNSFLEIILGDMMKIGLVSDYHALSSLENLNENDINNLVFYELKGKVIEEVNRSNRRGYFHSNSRLNQDMKASMKYESFHHAYDAYVRFESTKLQASYGDVNSSRELGLMYALGIGTKKDLKKAELHLHRCIMWGDIPSAILMSRILLEEKDKWNADRYSALYQLEKEYLEDGVIMLPECEKVGREVKDDYLCIALIKQYLVVQAKLTEIDIAFLNAIQQPELSLKVKLNYISRYKDNLWKNAVCGVSEKKSIGL